MLSHLCMCSRLSVRTLLSWFFSFSFSFFAVWRYNNKRVRWFNQRRAPVSCVTLKSVPRFRLVCISQEFQSIRIFSYILLDGRS
uniref:Uncharacterized protein n=1 Tax=Rhipicephalus appendiculatus TaxID=34631 RepID=A0A131YDD0_RHIAP